MLSIKKDIGTLMELAMQRADMITLPGGTTMSLTPGSVSRLLLACINAEFEMSYDKLEEVHLQSFLSTATGEYIDLIGELVACQRKASESDNDYKYRISKQVTILESSNELSIRMALLSVEGVSDVIPKAFTYGCGSFSAFVITESAIDQKKVIEACNEAVGKTAAYGTKFSIEIPDLLPVEIGVKLIFKSSAVNQGDIKVAARATIREYINSRTVGEDLVINEIIEKCMSLSDDIYDMNIYKLSIDGQIVSISNQSCRYNERFIESSVPNAIYVV